MTMSTTGPMDKNLAKILLAALFMGMVYFFASPWSGDYSLSWLVKSSGILLLALVAFLSRAPLGRDLALGLLFGAGGDILLDLGLFVPGLASFLVSHLVYTVLFLLIMKQSGIHGSYRKILVGVIALVAIALARWFAPDLGELTIPVLAYIAVIAVMAIAATLTPFHSRRVMIGALLFMLSDSLIALGKFKTGFPGIGFAIWATYFAAQYSITTGFLAGWRSKGN